MPPRVVGAFLLLVSLLSTPTWSAEPRVVLIERDPWRPVINSDMPTLALYADGLVIFRSRAAATRFEAAHLAREAQQRLLARVQPAVLLGLSDDYAVSDKTDQPTNELHLWVDGHRKTIAVYGALRNDRRARRHAPPAFLRAFDAITQVTADASPWLPEQIEVLLWPWDTTSPPVSWPNDWPALSTARVRGQSAVHQIFLPSAQLERLSALLHAQGGNRPVKLGWRTWAITYRLPFPGEEAWMR